MRPRAHGSHARVAPAIDNGKRTRPDDEMHGTRASGISIDDVRGVVNCAQDAEREAGGGASWFMAADSASLKSGLRREVPGQNPAGGLGAGPLRVVPGRRRVARRRPAAAARPSGSGRSRAPSPSGAWRAPSPSGTRVALRPTVVASRMRRSRTAAAVAVAIS